MNFYQKTILFDGLYKPADLLYEQPNWDDKTDNQFRVRGKQYEEFSEEKIPEYVGRGDWGTPGPVNLKTNL